MQRVLLIDDDETLCQLLAEYLVREGFEVRAAHGGVQGEALALSEEWDLIILDVMLPGMNGFDVLKRIKPACAAPVMMLTARGEDTDTVLGLELGADDYVAKPVSPRVLVARLRALQRRHRSDESATAVRVGDLLLDEAVRRVMLGDSEILLTGAEFNLLAILVRHAGHLVPREILAAQGLGRGLQAFDRRIETHIAQIRRKLGPLPDGAPRIQTVRGAGYQYAAHR